VSPPPNKPNKVSDTEPEYESDTMNLSNHTDEPDCHQAKYSFLLTDFDQMFQSPKMLHAKFLKYVPRDKISRLKPTRKRIIVKFSGSM